MPAIKFRGVDFIQYDSLLTDEERLTRDTARQFIEDNLIPIIEQCNRDGRFPRELVKPMADLGFFGAILRRLRLRRHVQRRIRPHHPGARARRLRCAQLCQRAVGARACIRSMTFGRTSRNITGCLSHADGRKAGLLRVDRARLRIESRRHAHPRAQGRRRVRAQRREDVDHLRLSIANVAIIWAKVEDEGAGQGEPKENWATIASADSSSRPTAPASPPTTFTANGRCARR